MAKGEGELYKQAQRRLAASLIHDGTDATKVFEAITPEDFEEPALQLIMSAILELVRTNIPISIISISKELESKAELAKAGGVSELYSLKDEGRKYLLENSVELYTSVVKEASAKFKISQHLRESINFFKEDSGVTAAESVSNLQSVLNEELYKLSDDSTVIELSESIEGYFELLAERKAISEENAKNAGGLQGIPCMLPSINEATTGWLPGQLITVGARTGVGKSVFAVNCAVAAAEANNSVLFFSLEMSNHELQDRIISSMSMVELNKVKQGNISPEERVILEHTAERASKMKLMIETEPKLTVDAIRAKAIKRSQSPEGLDLVILDYLQLVTPTGRHSSRQEAVAEISRNMKLLSKQLGVPVIVLVQMTRESKDDESSIPQISQIRESGAIAQDSDIVLLLHREKTVDGEIPDTLVIIAKQRNGKAEDIIRCSSNLEYSLLRERKRAKNIDNVTDQDLEDLADFEDSDLEDLNLSDVDSDLDFGE